MRSLEPVAEAGDAVPLSELEPGSAGLVAQVCAAEPIARRLADLGFLPGTRVQVVRRAPLGDPCVYALRGSQLCLRRSEARTVRVRPTAAPEGEA